MVLAFAALERHAALKQSRANVAIDFASLDGEVSSTARQYGRSLPLTTQGIKVRKGPFVAPAVTRAPTSQRPLAARNRPMLWQTTTVQKPMSAPPLRQCVCGSIASRSPSPKKLNAKTTITIGSIGIAVHQ